MAVSMDAVCVLVRRATIKDCIGGVDPCLVEQLERNDFPAP